MADNGIIFRAIWPIVDESVSFAALCREAHRELPTIIATAHAELLAPGRYFIAPSDRVPGSGRVTESCLLFEAPARPTPIRAYRKKAVA